MPTPLLAALSALIVGQVFNLSGRVQRTRQGQVENLTYEKPLSGEPTDWPTPRGDLQRSGFYPHFPAPPLKVLWRKELHGELVGPRCEVVVAGGRAYLGTYAGNFYCWDARTGEQRKLLHADGPVGHSAAVGEGLVVFAGGSTLFALDAKDDSIRWKQELDEAAWVAPTIAGGLVTVGDRGGMFHALHANDGRPGWKFQTGGPILTGSAVTEDGSAIVFASEDMHAYCLELPSGKLRWKSRKMAGLSARDYFPVIAGGVAMLSTSPVYDFHKDTLNAHDAFLVGRTGFTGKDRRYVPGTPADAEKEQDAILAYLKADPSRQTFYAFRLEDGKEPWVAPILYTSGLHNPPTPPCVNRKTGEVFVITRSAYGVWDGGGEVRSFTAVGRLDLKTGRVTLVEHGHRPKGEDRPPGSRDLPFASFNLIGDETQTLSCSPEYLFSNHQGTLGGMAFADGKCRVFWGKRDTYAGFYGPGTFGWEKDGGLLKAAAKGEPYGLVNEWHGPAKGAAAVAGDLVFLVTGSQVVCLQGGKP